MNPNEQAEQAENFEFAGIFDVKAEDFEQPTQSGLSEDFYQMKLDDEKVKDGRYVTIGRLVPDVNCGEVRRDRVTKHVYYLPDPEDASKRIYIDAPSNNPKVKDICTQAYMKHVYDKGKNYDQSTPIQLSKRLEVLKRNTYNYSLFLIYDDIQHPELNGKIKILRYGKVLNDKLDMLLKGDQVLKKKPVVPFDLINGKDLTIIVSEGQGNLPTYEQSYFNDGLCGISFDCGKTTVGEFNPEVGKQIFEFLKTNSPDLSQTYYKTLSEADEKLLIKCVKIAFGEQYYKEFCELYFEVYGTQYVPDYNNVSTQGGQASGATVVETEKKPTVQVEQPVITDTQSDKPSTVNTTSNFKSLKETPVETVVKTEEPAVQVKQPVETVVTETVVETETPVVTETVVEEVKDESQSSGTDYSEMDFDEIPDDI